MTPILIALVGLLILLALGLPLGISLLAVAIFGLTAVHPGGLGAALTITGAEASVFAMAPGFAVLPLFILMGVFVTKAEISHDLYEVFNNWIGHFKGGLAMATVGACGGFAAVSGSSLATAVTMAKVSVPVMRKYKYSDSFSAGTVAAGGTLGILIPPSAMLIIYGILAEVDIGKLFIAGIVPGFITILIYMAVIRIVVLVRPSAGPPGDRASWRVRFGTLYKTWGILFLFIFLMGGIFLGVFTASEAGSMGAAGALLFAIIRGKMSWRIFTDALIEAALTTGTVFSIAIGALVLNQFVNFTRFPQLLMAFIDSVGGTPMQVVVVILAIYIVLGMFIEGAAILFLTVPIFVPIVAGLGLDLIWWGIVTVIIVEISLITPPIGLNVYVISSVLEDVPVVKIFKGILPFFAGDIVRLSIVVAIPPVVMWLPNMM